MGVVVVVLQAATDKASSSSSLLVIASRIVGGIVVVGVVRTSTKHFIENLAVAGPRSKHAAQAAEMCGIETKCGTQLERGVEYRFVNKIWILIRRKIYPLIPSRSTE